MVLEVRGYKHRKKLLTFMSYSPNGGDHAVTNADGKGFPAARHP